MGIQVKSQYGAQRELTATKGKWDTLLFCTRKFVNFNFHVKIGAITRIQYNPMITLRHTSENVEMEIGTVGLEKATTCRYLEQPARGPTTT